MKSSSFHYSKQYFFKTGLSILILNPLTNFFKNCLSLSIECIKFRRLFQDEFRLFRVSSLGSLG